MMINPLRVRGGIGWMAGRGREASQDIASVSQFVFIKHPTDSGSKSPANIPLSLAMETAETVPSAGELIGGDAVMLMHSTNLGDWAWK